MNRIAHLKLLPVVHWLSMTHSEKKLLRVKNKKQNRWKKIFNFFSELVNGSKFIIYMCCLSRMISVRSIPEFSQVLRLCADKPADHSLPSPPLPQLFSWQFGAGVFNTYFMGSLQCPSWSARGFIVQHRRVKRAPEFDREARPNQYLRRHALCNIRDVGLYTGVRWLSLPNKHSQAVDPHLTLHLRTVQRDHWCQPLIPQCLITTPTKAKVLLERFFFSSPTLSRSERAVVPAPGSRVRYVASLMGHWRAVRLSEHLMHKTCAKFLQGQVTNELKVQSDWELGQKEGNWIGGDYLRALLG